MLPIVSESSAVLPKKYFHKNLEKKLLMISFFKDSDTYVSFLNSN